MSKEDKKQEVVEQPQGVSLEEATEEQLKAAAFDVQQQIKALQNQYNVIYTEIAKRQEEKQK